MTFLEAAIEVLRHEDEALHFGEIARRAVERELLSHVGRDPEAAMRSCLTSAVRGDPPDAVLVRTKPGHYQIKPGAELPDPPEDLVEETASKPKTRKSAKKTTKSKAESKSRSKAKADDADDADDEDDADDADDADDVDDAETETEEDDEDDDEGGRGVRFEAPTGSGLDGPTDVALVMANAMSRIVGERPELRQELEAMQARSAESANDAGGDRHENGRAERASSRGYERNGKADDKGEPKIERRTGRGRTREERNGNDAGRERDRDREDDRGGRRRRRRRNRGRRVEWAEVGDGRGADPREALLEAIASVLSEAGARSLHVRQIAEQLAAKDILGGDISELERAATAALLVDVGRFGTASRFVARGEARYQLRGARVPEEAAKAERSLYAAVREVERTTRANLGGWLRSLGARAFEAMVRMYLDYERYTLVATLPATRGYGRIVAEDPETEDRARTLIVAVPAKTEVERKLWEGDDARNECSTVTLFAAGDIPDNLPGNVRPIGVEELVEWMLDQGVGVRPVEVSLQVLDAELIESIGGLDT